MEKEAVFADNAPSLFAHDVAVIPIGPEREPLAAGFNRWSRRPGARTVAAWCDRYPEANIGIMPGLSGKVVFDCDSRDEVGQVEEILGPTDLRTNTNRGVHLWYDRACERLPGTLRRFGLNVDVKAGNSIVIAPPSIHESGKRYALADGCDWSALKHLRRPDVDKLRNFIAKQSAPKLDVARQEMRDGSRGQWLNDLLCSHAMSCDTHSELLDVARTANQRLADRGLEPLEEEEVAKRTKQVWKDAEAGKLGHWVGREGVARSRGSEIDELFKLDPKHAGDALALLMRLRIDHSARCKRGETFNITPKNMARANVIPGWPRERYERGRDLLLLAGLIGKATAFKITKDGRIGAQYQLSTYSGAGAVPVTTADRG